VKAVRPVVALAFAMMLGIGAASAQSAVGASTGNVATKFKDTSMFVPPAGARVAVLEWEDLECPYCARAFPSVHIAVKKYDIPLVERDYLIPGHAWSSTAALVARYLHDKVSPALATEYRREVFASQFRIASPDDLGEFTKAFFKANGKTLPANVDPDGTLRREIDADVALGDKAGVIQTPTIIVASAHHWTQVLDIDQLDKAIQDEEARSPAPVHHAVPAKK
jgi:protein-disulfide isomerase